MEFPATCSRHWRLARELVISMLGSGLSSGRAAREASCRQRGVGQSVPPLRNTTHPARCEAFPYLFQSQQIHHQNSKRTVQHQTFVAAQNSIPCSSSLGRGAQEPDTVGGVHPPEPLRWGRRLCPLEDTDTRSWDSG